jgi:hypothetical protein
LKNDQFDYPVFIDKENRINTLNQFPLNNMQFQRFLLDQNNQVQTIGNPILNLKVRELYKQKLIE